MTELIKKDNRTLSTIYNDIWKIYCVCDLGVYSPNDANMHGDILKSLHDLETAVNMVNQLQLFSTNEDIEEIATSEIKYLLLPALMGYFAENSSTLDNRLECVLKSDTYYRDYFRMCKLYKLTKKEPPTKPDGENTVRGRSRSNDRIAEYKETKQRDDKIRGFLDCDLEQLDDEVQRDYYLTLIQKFLYMAKQSLESFQMEIPILQHRQKLKDDKMYENEIKLKEMKLKDKKCTTPTFIITKDHQQKSVFGAGYPSVPVVTLDEYYNQKVASGEFPAVPSTADKKPHSESQGSMRRIEGGDASRSPADSEDTKAKKDHEIDTDDQTALDKARQWDEFKDDNRRGWGNRQNMG